MTPEPGRKRGTQRAIRTDSALTASARMQFVKLCDHAQNLYEAGQDLAGAEAYRRAALIAESIDVRHWSTRARFFQGAALHCAGRLHEALAVLAPVVAVEAELSNDDWVYMALTRYILIAVDLPVPLARIEAALEEAEARYSWAGKSGRRSRLLIVRARLALTRGRYPEALPLAQEALERRRHEGLAYSYTTYMRTLVEICTRLGDLALARNYLREWETLRAQYPASKEIFSAAAHSAILRREERFDAALEWARRAFATAYQTDDFVARFTALRAYVRALICTPESQRASEPLAELLRQRGCPIGDVRFEVRLLLGDYYLAGARRELGLPVVDLEFGPESERIWVAPDRSRSIRHLHRARRAYQWAQGAADELDALLDCDERSRRISARSAVFELAGE